MSVEQTGFQAEQLFLHSIDQEERFRNLGAAISQLEVVRHQVIHNAMLAESSRESFIIGKDLFLFPRLDHSYSDGTQLQIRPHADKYKGSYDVNVGRYGMKLYYRPNPGTFNFDDPDYPVVREYNPQQLLDGGQKTAHETAFFTMYADKAHRFVMKAYTRNKRMMRRLI